MDIVAINSTDVEYYINGVNFKDFGVYVSCSTGLIGLLERKDGLIMDWGSYHGKVRDSRQRYKERKISLDCFIEAASRTDFVNKVMGFFNCFNSKGSQRLKVDYGVSNKPLVYEVVASKNVEFTRTWNPNNVATFKMELEEDEPVKRVVLASGSCTISLSSNTLVNIHWGDGTHTYGLYGQNRSVSHSFVTGGVHEVIIAGVIEDIKDFSTTGEVIWDILK